MASLSVPMRKIRCTAEEATDVSPFCLGKVNETFQQYAHYILDRHRPQLTVIFYNPRLSQFLTCWCPDRCGQNGAGGLGRVCKTHSRAIANTKGDRYQMKNSLLHRNRQLIAYSHSKIEAMVNIAR